MGILQDWKPYGPESLGYIRKHYNLKFFMCFLKALNGPKSLGYIRKNYNLKFQYPNDSSDLYYGRPYRTVKSFES